jgi:hypothetical protein
MIPEAIARYLRSAAVYVRLGRHRSAAKDLNDVTALLLQTGQPHAAGRARGIVHQILADHERRDLTDESAEPLTNRDRVAFAVGFDAGYRGSPYSEIGSLLEAVGTGEPLE